MPHVTLKRQLDKLESKLMINGDESFQAIFITMVDNSKIGEGRTFPVLGWRFQRHGADDIVTMREQGEDDEALQERHLEAVRPILAPQAVPMFLPVIDE